MYRFTELYVDFIRKILISNYDTFVFVLYVNLVFLCIYESLFSVRCSLVTSTPMHTNTLLSRRIATINNFSFDDKIVEPSSFYPILDKYVYYLYNII